MPSADSMKPVNGTVPAVVDAVVVAGSARSEVPELHAVPMLIIVAMTAADTRVRTTVAPLICRP
ncbi:hypothetical protein XA26_20170 [Mycolicibacterium fortuitum]|uniref:Uncharacterized protein n=1 Tax=Mycolicibacterium fortuitum TaxID=1766 RepID=A0A0N7H8C8_MYCFO|nr:hypothetical protein XA26_20170 [Mycolicibacterium fortuitum]